MALIFVAFVLLESQANGNQSVSSRSLQGNHKAPMPAQPKRSCARGRLLELSRLPRQ